MGIFGSPSDTYSQEEKSLSTDDIRRLVSLAKVSTLSQKEEKVVEEALIVRKGGDGRISLRQIYQELVKLEQRNHISEFDKKKLLKIFEEALT